LQQKLIQHYVVAGRVRRSFIGGFPASWLDFLILTTAEFWKVCFPGGKSTNCFQIHQDGLDFVPEPGKPQVVATTEPTQPAQQQNTTPADVLRSIERGLEAPANGHAGWGSLAHSHTVSRPSVTFPVAVASAGIETESPAQRIARSLLTLSKRLRLSDTELTGLANLAGYVVELDLTCSIDIDAAGWSTVTYSHELLNLTNRSIKRLTRELWFETTDGPLTIEPSPSNDRKVAIQRIHDMNNLSKFACHISPAIDPGETISLSYSCRGGQFVHDHYWRQAVPRYTRHLTLNIRQRGVDMLLNCTAIEEQADGSEVSATEDLVCADDSGDAVMTLTRNYLQPSQAVTLRWEISRASS
jgi:hypothetical protein